MRTMLSKMWFGAMQTNKANIKVTRKNSVLCTMKMADHYIDEKIVTIIVISGKND
jgi:hypothetical protein